MIYYGMVACVQTLTEGLWSEIWSEKPVKVPLHLLNKRFFLYTYSQLDMPILSIK
jgi:hypothetical protein